LDGEEDSVIAIPPDSLPFQNIHHGVFSTENLACKNENLGKLLICK
jgi:hypothetical protein